MTEKRNLFKEKLHKYHKYNKTKTRKEKKIIKIDFKAIHIERKIRCNEPREKENNFKTLPINRESNIKIRI